MPFLKRWAKEKIKVKGSEIEIDGVVFGNLAVHLSLSDGSLFVVTASTVGLRVCHVNKEKDAKRIAETLHRYCAKAFQEKTAQNILDKLPLWVKPWLYECTKERKWVDVEEFQKKYKWTPSK